MKSHFVSPMMFAALAALLTPPLLAQEFRQTFPLNPNARFSITNVSGDIEIAAWDRSEAEVVAEKTGPDAARVEIQVNARPDSVDVHTHYPSRTNATVIYRIRVPKRVVLDGVQNVSGSIRINGVIGRVDAASVSGDVFIREVQGPVAAKSVSGAVAVEFGVSNPAGSVVDSISGDVELIAPPSLNAEFEMRSISGTLNTDFPVTLEGSTISRTAKTRVGSGGNRISIRTISGNIQLKKK